MSLSIQPETTERVPLVVNADGAVLVEGTRVPLDAVIEAFNNGKTAEEIVFSYTTLGLADVYAVIAYYLRHQRDVDDHIAERRRDAGALRARIESHSDVRGIRERLIARQKSQQP